MKTALLEDVANRNNLIRTLEEEVRDTLDDMASIGLADEGLDAFDAISFYGGEFAVRWTFEEFQLLYITVLAHVQK